ncbi:MAG: RNA polymerase sigma factor [Planctomycetota bacterium]
MTDGDTTTLLRQFDRGAPDAFAALHARLAARLYMWSSLRIPRPLWARLHPEDLVQEIWLRVVASLERYEPQRASFRSWVFGIAARTLAENLRRLAVRRREGVGEAGGVAPDELPLAVTSMVRGVARAEELKRLSELIAALPAPDRQLLLWRGLEGLPHGEVATRLCVSPEAAEIRWRRLVSRLRLRWSGLGLGEFA